MVEETPKVFDLSSLAGQAKAAWDEAGGHRTILFRRLAWTLVVGSIVLGLIGLLFLSSGQEKEEVVLFLLVSLGLTTGLLAAVSGRFAEAGGLYVSEIALAEDGILLTTVGGRETKLAWNDRKLNLCFRNRTKEKRPGPREFLDLGPLSVWAERGGKPVGLAYLTPEAFDVVLGAAKGSEAPFFHEPEHPTRFGTIGDRFWVGASALKRIEFRRKHRRARFE